MTAPGEPGDLAAEVAYLTSAKAVRDRAELLYGRALAGRSTHFRVDEARLDDAVERVVSATLAAYPDVHRIPYHGRFRHFSAGGVDRLGRLEGALAGVASDERVAAMFDLVIPSVLLDAGAGDSWSYREGGAAYARSEGLAVASFDWFASGGLSADEARPFRADGARLAALDEASLRAAFRVTDANPLVGVAGRVTLLRRLGDVVNASPSHFGSEARLGNLGVWLRASARGGRLPATAILDAVLAVLGPIWPGRESLGGRNLGDVWRHPDVGLVPLHKLSQWLTYSLVEPLEAAGVEVTDLDDLTGLAEYRNGGLFVDTGVLAPVDPGVLDAAHEVSSPLVVEWRSLTVALLDRTAVRVRARLGLGSAELPLARVLEGGTWSAGRAVAKERRAGGGPPIRVVSDGTVF